MMREWPYSASSRDILGCTSPTTKRFPEAREISRGTSRGPWQCTDTIKRNFGTCNCLNMLYKAKMFNICADPFWGLCWTKSSPSLTKVLPVCHVLANIRNKTSSMIVRWKVSWNSINLWQWLCTFDVYIHMSKVVYLSSTSFGILEYYLRDCFQYQTLLLA